MAVFVRDPTSKLLAKGADGGFGQVGKAWHELKYFLGYINGHRRVLDDFIRRGCEVVIFDPFELASFVIPIARFVELHKQYPKPDQREIWLKEFKVTPEV